MDVFEGVLVYCEVADGQLDQITWELLGFGRKLADQLGESLTAVMLGDGIKKLAEDEIIYGADTVYISDDALFKDYQPDPCLAVMEKIVRKASPRIIIFGQTFIGRDLAPRLAFRFNTTATLDCVDLSIEPDTNKLLQTKPIYGGNAWAVYTSECRPQIATVRAKSISPQIPDKSKKGTLIDVDPEIRHLEMKTRLLEKFPELEEGIRLTDARVVVGGGRGIGSKEGFDILKELAEILNGTVGGTRVACDNGWLPNSKLIGLTGKVINPNLYIAIALSGASQHMAGCYGTKNIIAINKDDNANIFREAKYGVLGDWREVLPGFLRKVREIRVSSS